MRNERLLIFTSGTMKNGKNYTPVQKSIHGFTLVELLVVISIIALLMSIMMPTVTRVRSFANRVVCANHLQQQGLSLAVYANDYNNNYPPSTYNKDLHIQWLKWPFGGMLHKTSDGEHIPAGQVALLEYGYLKDPKFLFCPAVPEKRDRAQATFEELWDGNTDAPDDFTKYNFARVGYPYWVKYLWAAERADSPRNIRLKQVTAENASSRSDKVLITDSIITDVNPPNGNYEYYPRLSNHLVNSNRVSGGNILYNDMSIAWSRMDDIVKDEDEHKRVVDLFHLRAIFWF